MRKERGGPTSRDVQLSTRSLSGQNISQYGGRTFSGSHHGPLVGREQSTGGDRVRLSTTIYALTEMACLAKTMLLLSIGASKAVVGFIPCRCLEIRVDQFYGQSLSLPMQCSVCVVCVCRLVCASSSTFRLFIYLSNPLLLLNYFPPLFAHPTFRN